MERTKERGNEVLYEKSGADDRRTAGNQVKGERVGNNAGGGQRLRSGSDGEPCVLLYDGDCALCSRIVRFAAKRDPQAVFRFAPLASGPGRERLARLGLPERTDSFVLVEGGAGYVKSEAALRVLLRLRGAWPLLYALKAVPVRWRDAVYDMVAARRYRWFGQSESGCPLPEPELRYRILASDETEEEYEK